MGFEERCDRQARELPEQLDLLAMSARSRSWEPSHDTALALMLACVDLAGSLLAHLEPFPAKEE